MHRLATMCLAVALLSGCGEETGSSANAINGKDFSGTYRLDGVLCFDETGADITAVAEFSSSSALTYLTITGNRSSETSSSSSCSATTEGELTFTGASSSADGSYGTMDGRSTAIRVSGGSTCTLSATLVPVSGSPAVTPSSFTRTYSASSPLASSSAGYLKPPGGDLFLRTSIQVVGYPTDMCFFVYTKL